MHTNGYHSHTHNHCNHDIAYCRVCDICYCTKCNREWGTKQYYVDTQPRYWIYSGIPYRVTYDAGGGYSLMTNNGTVVTNETVLTAFTAESKRNINSVSTNHNHI